MMFTKEQLIDSTGSKRTQSLFAETNGTLYEPIMTLHSQPRLYKGKTLPSLHEIYNQEADPEEYRVAMRVFGNWNQWVLMLGNKKIMKYIKLYREELEVRIRSEAVKSLIDSAGLDGPRGISAAKYIAENGWKKRKAGAPSKEEVQSELKVHTKMDKDLEEDMKRINLRVIK